MTPTERLAAEVRERRAWTPAQLAARFGGRSFGGRVVPTDVADIVAELESGDPRLRGLPPSLHHADYLIPSHVAVRLIWPAAALRLERAARRAREDAMAVQIAGEDPARIAALRAEIESILPDGFVATEIALPPSRRPFGYRRTTTYRVDIADGSRWIHPFGGTARIPAHEAALERAKTLRLEASVRAIDGGARQESLTDGWSLTIDGRTLLVYREVPADQVKFGSQEADIFDEIDDYGLIGEPVIVTLPEYLTPDALRRTLKAVPQGGLVRRPRR